MAIQSLTGFARKGGNNALSALDLLIMEGYRNLPEVVQARHDRPATVPLSDEQWAAADEIAIRKAAARRAELQPQFDSAKAASNRIARIEEFIRENCQRQSLTSFFLHDHDGELSKIKATRWNTDKCEKWFSYGKLSSSDAYGGGGNSNEREYWLFFGRSELEALTTPPLSVPSNIGDEIYLSPYMQLMIDVVRGCRLTKEDQGNRDSILAYIENQWKKRGLPHSANLMKVMATLVRDPKSQLGRAKK